jgi:type VI secretion system protein ImpG
VDPRWLDLYQRELRHLREGGAEFAREFPKIAARLGLDAADDGQACPDPFVERLLEGFAFLAARVELQQEIGQARLASHLLDRLLPDHAAPTPSMAVVQFQPDLDDPSLVHGPRVPAGRMLTATPRGGGSPPCRFRSGHEVRLWPLTIASASWQPTSVALRLSFAVTGGWRCDQLALDELVLHVVGEDVTAHALHGGLLSLVRAVHVVDPAEPARVLSRGPASRLVAVGADPAEALLPVSDRAPQGHRLLREYAAFPARFLFLRIDGLRPALRRITSSSFEVHLLLDRADPTLEACVDARAFALHCTPVVNLFPKRADRVDLNRRDAEFRVVPDRMATASHEVHSIVAVTGLDRAGVRATRTFLPLHAIVDLPGPRGPAWYAVRRAPRIEPRSEAGGARAACRPVHDAWISICDPGEPPWPDDVAQLAVDTLCTNRDAPLALPAGEGTAWHLEDGAPVQCVRCLRAPSPPLEAWREGRSTWALLGMAASSLGSLVGDRGPAGDMPLADPAAALRAHLGLHAADPRSPLQRQVEGIVSVSSRSVVRRLPEPGPIVFGRGVAVELTIDEPAFVGTGPWVLGDVLHRWLAGRIAMNSFVELTLRSATRDVLLRWPARAGGRSLA